MRTLLLFPPPADPAHPPLGIAALAGYMAERGEDVSLVDLNIRAYGDLLSPTFLTTCAKKMRRRLGAFRRRRTLPAGELAAYTALAENLPAAEWLTGRIEEAKRRLRDASTYASREAYAETTAILRRAMQFVSAAHHPATWSAGGFALSHHATRSADVLRATQDRRENLFLPLFESVLPELVARRPHIVGISLNYRMQTIPAITLAALIRKALPEARIVFGGGLISFFALDWTVLAPFRDLVDAWVPFEGEKPLFDLTRKDTADVAGVLRFVGGAPVYRPPGPPPALSELPPPRFDGLPLGDYLAPEPILPLLGSRGCYWGRCMFCAHGHLYRAQYRSESAANVLETMRALSAESGASLFYFVDEAVPPRTAVALANAIHDAVLPYRWFGEARFERYFDTARIRRMAEGGCRMLLFGLESGVPRLLDLMDKGITPDRVARILRDCTASGIRTFVMFFTGFPTETREEAEATLRFIEEHRADVTHACGGQFILEPQAPVYRDRAHYGITRVYPYPDEDLKTWSQYDVASGLTAAEAGEMAKNVEHLPMMNAPDFYLVSRSHLVFLPAEQESPQIEVVLPADLTQPERVAPLRRSDLVPQRLPFNLDDVHTHLADGTAAPSTATDYVFSPDLEAMVEVGPDGLDLLKACGGEFALAEILDAVGNENRDRTLRFLRDLEQRRLLFFETRP